MREYSGWLPRRAESWELKADAEGAELGAIEANLQQPELKDAAQLLADGQPTDALDKAHKFLATHPDDLLAMTIAAEALMELWDLERAEALLRSVMARAPTFLRGSMLLATCLGKQVRLRQAISVIEEALLRKPNHAQLLSRLAQLRSNVGDNEEAVLIFEKLVQQYPGVGQRWHNVADQYRIVGRREESIAAFRKSLSIDPHNASRLVDLGQLFSEGARRPG